MDGSPGAPTPRPSANASDTAAYEPPNATCTPFPEPMTKPSPHSATSVTPQKPYTWDALFTTVQAWALLAEAALVHPRGVAGVALACMMAGAVMAVILAWGGVGPTTAALLAT